MRKLRLALAKWLWPKEVKKGELFTIVQHLRGGQPTYDGSWVGETCRADIVDGDRIGFSVLNRYASPKRFDYVPSLWLIPGRNCLIKPIAIAMTAAQTNEMYHNAKKGYDSMKTPLASALRNNIT